MCFGEVSRDHLAHSFSEFGIRRDAARDDDGFGLIFNDRAASFCNENIERGFLEFSADGVDKVFVVSFVFVFFQKIQDGGFETRERKAIVRRVNKRTRE